MKKLFFLFVMMIGLSVQAMAKDVITRDINQLPQAARTTIQKYFAKAKLSYIKIDKDFLEAATYEAIFEDDDGNEFFDKSAYDILVENVLGRKIQEESPKQDSIEETLPADIAQPIEEKNNETEQAVEQVVEESNVVSQDASEINKEIPLENIKWHRWDDVSVELVDNNSQSEQNIIDGELPIEKQEDISVVENNLEQETLSNDTAPVDNFVEELPQTPPAVETQQEYWNSEPVAESPNIQEKPATEESKKEIQQIMSTPDEGDEDFDDIGLLSDSIQAQEKFQKYIVNELAKRNIDVTPPKPENAFKFDISEKTLNMIARAIAKKIAKQVSMVLSTDQKNNTKLIQAEKKSQMLEQKVNSLEEQNKKLKLLLAQSNKNLNSYKPTFFGLYRFVNRKPEKRK